MPVSLETRRQLRRRALASETPEQKASRLERERPGKLAWYRRNKPHARNYYQQNRAKILAREKERVKSFSPERNQQRLVRMRNWYAENRERQQAKNLESQKRNRPAANARLKRFYARHPERALQQAHRYRARKRKADVGQSAPISAWMEKVRSLPLFRCYYCSVVHLTTNLNFDHVIPLARGGAHSLTNLAASCAGCNKSKNDCLPHEWNKHAQIFLSL